MTRRDGYEKARGERKKNGEWESGGISSSYLCQKMAVKEMCGSRDS